MNTNFRYEPGFFLILKHKLKFQTDSTDYLLFHETLDIYWHTIEVLFILSHNITGTGMYLLTHNRSVLMVKVHIVLNSVYLKKKYSAYSETSVPILNN